MPLDPQAAALRKLRIAEGARPVAELTADEARGPGPARGETLRFRIYRPRERSRRPLPVLVYFHGGGFALGGLDANDEVCAALAREAGCAVVAAEYRLAPEHPFPAGIEDCDAALRRVAAEAEGLGLDGRRIAIGGASSGATLATVVARLARDRGGPKLNFQLLVYPVVAYRSGTPSLAERGDPYFLDAAALEWVWSHYLPRGVDTDDPRISPLRATDLRGMPPALVILAGEDPLHDEGLLYAEALAQAGVEVQVVEYPGLPHGFFSLLELDAATSAHQRAGEALRQALR
jgi:acetyl esterase